MILGILGQAGAGKDTLADYLVKKYGFVKMALADPLKRICRDVYNFSDEQLWGPSKNRNSEDYRYLRGTMDKPDTDPRYLTPRFALQTLGTEWGRICYGNTWVEYGLRTAALVESGAYNYSAKTGSVRRSLLARIVTAIIGNSSPGVVIPDIRFKNEVSALKDHHGLVVRVKRGHLEDRVGGITGHASEEEQKTIQDHELDYILEVPEDVEPFPKYHEAIDRMMLRLPKGGIRLRVVHGP